MPNGFHPIIVDGKNEHLKKICLMLKWGMLSVFLVLYALLALGTSLNS